MAAARTNVQRGGNHGQTKTQAGKAKASPQAAEGEGHFHNREGNADHSGQSELSVWEDLRIEFFIDSR
jgi:hypothetical protein